MSLIGVSLKNVFIKFAHMEFPLFKVSHYLHCTLRLLDICFFFLYWACPLSNLVQVGEPNTPSCFRKHRGVPIPNHCKQGQRLDNFLLTICPKRTNNFCNHRTNAIHYEHYFAFTIAIINMREFHHYFPSTSTSRSCSKGDCSSGILFNI